MDNIEETNWDVIIAGTGLQESLLALALSRCGQKVLHVDKNDYYGSSAAALTLDDAQAWIDAVTADSAYHKPFAAATIHRPTSQHATSSSGVSLSPSRRYNVTLNPVVIPARSSFLSSVVSARIDQQLEFVAHGSPWFIGSQTNSKEQQDHQQSDGTGETPNPPSKIRKVPSTREDILNNDIIDAKDKRKINKFLRFVSDLDGEDKREIWQPAQDEPFDKFLSDNFRLDNDLQAPLHALTGSLDGPSETKTGWALRRIETYFKSIGALGPGFGAVLPKYGGLAEIVQASCRAQAVGGGIYMLGHGLSEIRNRQENVKCPLEVELSNGEKVKTRWLVAGSDNVPGGATVGNRVGKIVSHSVSVVSKPLEQLFAKSTDEGPDPAGVTVSVLHEADSLPIHIIAHNANTSECPAGQCILYAVIKHQDAFDKLEAAISTIIADMDSEAQVLWRLQYKHRSMSVRPDEKLHSNIVVFDEPDTDLYFDESILDSVKSAWKKVLGLENGKGEFLRFPPREGEEPDQEDVG